LTQRIQFLEAKGLTGPEIELALQQASINQTGVQPYQTVYPFSIAASRPWDWRDYFVESFIFLIGSSSNDLTLDHSHGHWGHYIRSSCIVQGMSYLVHQEWFVNI
jgi:hypothetical protein